MMLTTYEPETADVVLDGDGCCWRYSGTEDHAMGFRWESFDGASLKRSDPPQPLTLLVRNGRPVDGTGRDASTERRELDRVVGLPSEVSDRAEEWLRGRDG